MGSTLTLPEKKNASSSRHTWHGMAFIMEALVLILFLILSMAILLQVFSASRAHGEKAYSISYAITLATNEAERFAANPNSATTQFYDLVDGVLVPSENPTQDSYSVSRDVTPEGTSAGTLYRADIKVEKGGETLYELATTRYMKAGG